jgi:hypothetical protein
MHDPLEEEIAAMTRGERRGLQIQCGDIFVGVGRYWLQTATRSRRRHAVRHAAGKAAAAFMKAAIVFVDAGQPQRARIAGAVIRRIGRMFHQHDQQNEEVRHDSQAEAVDRDGPAPGVDR